VATRRVAEQSGHPSGIRSGIGEQAQRRYVPIPAGAPTTPWPLASEWTGHFDRSSMVTSSESAFKPSRQSITMKLKFKKLYPESSRETVTSGSVFTRHEAIFLALMG
jgi:hypothetical protein